jgi:hypothetical protein
MTSFLAGGLAKAIAAGFKNQLLAGTLRKTMVDGRDSFGDPTSTTADYAVQGMEDRYSAMVKVAAGIPATDVKLLLIAGLCDAAPSIGDKVQLNGQWFQVRDVSIDPAGATYECQSFRVTVA